MPRTCTLKRFPVLAGLLLILLGAYLVILNHSTAQELFAKLNPSFLWSMLSDPILVSCVGIFAMMLGFLLAAIGATWVSPSKTIKKPVLWCNLSENHGENAKVGYKAAIDIWNTEVATGWSRFSAMVLANSVVISAIAVMIRNGLPFPPLIKALPLVGLGICLAWFGIMWRGFRYTDYWMNAALELEDNYLKPLQLIKKRISFVKGEEFTPNVDGAKGVRIGLLGRAARARYVASAVILIFVVVYFLALLQLMRS